MAIKQSLEHSHRQVSFVDPTYTPRYYQIPVFIARAKGVKRFVLIWHRRSGKDKTSLELLLTEAFEKAGNYWYMFPNYEQAKRALWEAIDGEGRRVLDRIPKQLLFKKIPASEMVIHLKTRANIMGEDPSSHSVIRLIGADDPSSLAGANPIGVVCSEFGLWTKPSAYYQTVEPMLLENGGWVLFNSTSRGKNHLWSLYNAAKDNSEWFVSNLDITKTAKQILVPKEDGTEEKKWVPVISEKDIQGLRELGQTSEEIIQREYYNSFDATPADAFFADALSSLYEKNRINNDIFYNPKLKTYTVWDFGVTSSSATKPKDRMAVWVIQVGHHNNQEFFNCIDYMEFIHEGLIKSAKHVLNLPYAYDKHIAPHDITRTNTDLGIGRAEIAKQAGLNFYDAQGALNPAKKLPYMDRINILREYLPRCQFLADQTLDGIECIRCTRQNWSQEDRDTYSHGTDALSYFFVWWQQYGATELQRLKVFPKSVNMGYSVFDN